MHPINMISLQVLIPNVLTMELSLHKKKKKKKTYRIILASIYVMKIFIFFFWDKNIKTRTYCHN